MRLTPLTSWVPEGGFVGGYPAGQLWTWSMLASRNPTNFNETPGSSYFTFTKSATSLVIAAFSPGISMFATGNGETIGFTEQGSNLFDCNLSSFPCNKAWAEAFRVAYNLSAVGTWEGAQGYNILPKLAAGWAKVLMDGVLYPIGVPGGCTLYIHPTSDWAVIRPWVITGNTNSDVLMAACRVANPDSWYPNTLAVWWGANLGL